MDIVIQPNLEIIRQIGGPQYRIYGRKYRLNRYCLEHKIKEGILIYNAMVGSLVFLKSYERINIFTEDPCDYAEFLLNNYFIVPEQFEEKPLVDMIRERKWQPITYNYLDSPKHFTILTTTTCNARCFYCYELKSKGKTPMSIETAEKVAKYIITHCPKGTEVSLDWFGGEPLFNLNVIDIIISRISSAGYRYRSAMISNGYLMNEETAKKAKDFWNLSNIQITLDGTEKIYNKVKNYIHKDNSNPYKTVINNIHYLLDNNITVSVRMNCDKHNEEDLKELVKYLSEEFKDKDNFSMYVWPIFEEGFKRSLEDHEKLYKALEEIEKLIVEKGYPLCHSIENDIRGIHCMVDSGKGVLISPNGDLGLCEHYIDSRFFGHIDNPNKKNFEEIKTWRNYRPYGDICQNCPLYPICLRMKDCPDDFDCDKVIYDYKIHHAQLDMENSYKNFLKGNTQCQNNTCCNKHLISLYEKVITHADGTVEHIPINNNDNSLS